MAGKTSKVRWIGRFLAIWAGLVVSHFLFILLVTAWRAIQDDALRAFSVVTRLEEILKTGGIAILAVIVLMFASWLVNKRRKN